MTQAPTVSNTPVPMGPHITELEERFVMTVHDNRLLLKKLRQVKLEHYFSVKAKRVAEQLLSGKPVIDPIPVKQTLTSEEVAEAVHTIADMASLRQVLGYSRDLHEASRTGDVNRARKLLAHRPQASSVSLGGSVAETSASYVAKVARGTDFKQLDSPLGTRFLMEAGAIHVIAAGPGGGKSALAECIGIELSAKGEKVLDVSVELTEIPKYSRYAQHFEGPSVGLQAYASSSVDHAALARATRRLQDNTNLKLVCGLSNLYDIMDAIRHHVAESGVRVVIIDFLQIINVPGCSQAYEKLEVITQELKDLGDELGITQFWLSQLNRSGRTADKLSRPTMAHAEGSGRIEQLAWTALVLNNTGNKVPGTEYSVIDGYFDKVRYGGAGLLKATFDGSHYDLYFEGQKPLLERIARYAPGTGLV